MRLDRDALAARQARHGTALDAKAVARELEWQMPREKRTATVERFVQLADRRNHPLEQEAVAQIVAEMNRRLGTGDKHIEVDPLAVETGRPEAGFLERRLGLVVDVHGYGPAGDWFSSPSCSSFPKAPAGWQRTANPTGPAPS